MKSTDEERMKNAPPDLPAGGSPVGPATSGSPPASGGPPPGDSSGRPTGNPRGAAPPPSVLPGADLCYDPAEPRYHDPASLRGELDRAFDICHGCRMCFKYCDAFRDLFSIIDEAKDGDPRSLTDGEQDQVLAGCFQCKQCEFACPYTPGKGHEFQLDFPNLAHRHAAVRREQRPPTGRAALRDALLTDPDRGGRLQRTVPAFAAGFVERLQNSRPARWCLEKAVGIHREKLLPPFARESFDDWAAKHRPPPAPGREAVLFPTCYVQNNEPQIGRDTLEVLDRNGVETDCAPGLACCGMPSWEGGDLEAVRRAVKRNLEILGPFVAAGARVIAVNPTCSMLLRKDYPTLAAPEDREAAGRLAEAVRDPSEHLWSIRREERFNTDFRSSPGARVAYHAPCHLRAQGVGFRARDLIRKIPGVTPVATLECSGHDGTFALKTEGFAPSIAAGKKAFDSMRAAEADLWATDCPLAAIQFEQHAGKKPLHPMTVLARAYREDGFDDRLPAPDDPPADPPAGAHPPEASSA